MNATKVKKDSSSPAPCTTKGRVQQYDPADIITRLRALEENAIRCNPPRNLSIIEGARYVGISRARMNELLAERVIRHVKLGRRVILRTSDLDSFLQKNIR